MSKKNRKITDNEFDTKAGVNNVDENQSSGIGIGKKVGIYGCGFLILAIIIFFVVLVLTGMYVPFEGTEGVGP